MRPAILALCLSLASPVPGSTTPGSAALAPEGEVVLKIDLTRFAVLGSSSAPVVVLEFSDFRCPACEKFSLTIMPNLTKEFIQPGKLKVAFVDFPMQGEESYTTVFESVHCAGKQGKYWQMHEALWENVGAFGDRQVLGYAGKLGLDMGAFTRCLDGDEFRERVLNNARFANKLGLGARPTFFIGRKLPNAQAGSYK
ncbi:MAG TPA: thioredoxin domain-containing protein, partial [Patescibacteria group bacterium]|nr:thioredoxin domain-containing protein [Patescibacteria group bacterium]